LGGSDSASNDGTPMTWSMARISSGVCGVYIVTAYFSASMTSW
jgi:hypothetical protein